jgi:hypothetical protein
MPSNTNIAATKKKSFFNEMPPMMLWALASRLLPTIARTGRGAKRAKRKKAETNFSRADYSDNAPGLNSSAPAKNGPLGALKLFCSR